ncbi:MAG: hypothetical protein CR975_05070 [Gammaproteobacteria bacterium]|nr:MAG: hypothetical protein CR975_05070 [Gammaproteobacteria bacterium]
MILWSVRELSELEQLQRKGFLSTDPKRIDPDYLTAYHWISRQLEKKVPKPRKDYHYPIWAWQCWDSNRSCRPDLRVRWGKRGERMVLISFEIPDKLVLLSDFHLWHFVLNRSFLANNQQAEDDFSALSRKKDKASQTLCEQKITDSWQYIFDWQAVDTTYFGEGLGTSIQAVCWEIRTDWIKSVRLFKSK